MDEEEISESELTDLIKRFEHDLTNNRFDYYAQHLLVALIDHYLDHASYDKASEAAELALEQHPFHAAFFAKKAFIYTIEEKPEEALDVINQALDLEPGNPEYLTQKGSIYEHMQQPMKALDLFDEALENDAFVNDVLVLKMFVYYNLGNHDLALSMIEKIFTSPVNEDRLVMETHFCLQLMEKYDDGIRIFEAYTDLDPFQEVVWYHIGQLYAAKGDFKGAVNAFEFAIAIDETYVEPLLERGFCLIQEEKYQQAAKSFEEYIELDGADPMAYTQLGDCYQKMELNKKAATFYRQALKIDAKYVPAWLGLGVSFANKGLYTEALPFLVKASKIQPNDEFVLIELAKVLTFLERVDEAEDTLEYIIEGSPNFQPAWYVLAHLHLDEGDPLEAIHVLERWLARNPEDARAYYTIAAYYFALKQGQLGREYLTEGLLKDFEKHTIVFEEAPYLKDLKVINDIIDLYRK